MYTITGIHTMIEHNTDSGTVMQKTLQLRNKCFTPPPLPPHQCSFVRHVQLHRLPYTLICQNGSENNFKFSVNFCCYKYVSAPSS